MKKKVLVCHGIDNWNKEYTHYVSVDENKVDEEIARLKESCTEIVDIEVFPLYDAI